MNLSLSALHALLSASIDVFRKEEAVVHVNSTRAMIVGDIHGNRKALDLMLRVKKELNCDIIIFLGDYVDRGPDSVGVLSCLLDLKMKAPQSVILLRGNHESMEMNFHYGFYEELNRDISLLSLADSVFSELPVASVINGDVFCVHGGIPGAVSTDSITKEDAFGFMWNDPSGKEGITLSDRGMRPKCFGSDILSQFLLKNKLSRMIRGHSALKNGYRWWFDKRLLSLFSSPAYCGSSNKGAFALLENGMIKVRIFGPDETGDYSLEQETPADLDGCTVK